MVYDSQIKTLILTLQYEHRASYYDDWAGAFTNSDLFDCRILNLMKIRPERLAASIEEYDLVILLHSAVSDTLDYLKPVQPVLAQRKRAKLFAFVGNEFNSPYVPLSGKTSLLKRCRADVIATQLLKDAGQYIYENSGAIIVSVPHALNPQLFNSDKPHARRKIDVGMRSYRYPPYLGDNDRNSIIDYFVSHSGKLGLVSDISTTKRFTPVNWAAFLGNCKCVLATETGSFYLSPNDDLVNQVNLYAQERRSGIVISEASTLRRIVRYLPAAMKSPLISLLSLLKIGPVKYGVFEDEKLDFDDVYERFFKYAKKCPTYSKAISSRNFDAIGTKTCQIAFPGRFSDILQADEHYISLNRDFSNISEVAEKLRDEKYWKTIVDSAYDLVISNHTYAHRTRQIYDIVQAL